MASLLAERHVTRNLSRDMGPWSVGDFVCADVVHERRNGDRAFIPPKEQPWRGQIFFRYTDQQQHRECQASEMSTRPPKLQVLIETLGLSIPTELHEQLSTGPVPMQNWKSLEAERERLFGESRDTILSWDSNFSQSIDEVEMSGMEVVFCIARWITGASYISLTEKPKGEPDRDRYTDDQEKLNRAHIHAVSSKVGLEVMNDEFVFAYGHGDCLMGLVAKKAHGQARGRRGAPRLLSTGCVHVLECNR